MSETPTSRPPETPHEKKTPSRRIAVAYDKVSYLNPKRHPIVGSALLTGITVFVALSPRVLGTPQDLWLGMTAVATLSGGVMGGLLGVARDFLRNIPPRR